MGSDRCIKGGVMIVFNSSDSLISITQLLIFSKDQSFDSQINLSTNILKNKIKKG